MTDIAAALTEARDWLSAKETGNLNYLCTRLATALVTLTAEREAMAKVVEAAEAWRDADARLDAACDEAAYRGTSVPSHVRKALYATTEPLRDSVDALRAALDARKGEP